MLEARVVLAKVVKGCLVEEVRNVIGQIVTSDIVIVDEMNMRAIDKNIRA